MAVTLSLGVLDQSPVPDGTPAVDAVAATIALAQAAEGFGYRRFWVAEHHNSGSIAGTAPEVMVAAVAAHTSSIRVGAGGVLLGYYSPLKVAECFRVLHTLFPGRIDLGIGRASGADRRAEGALHFASAPPGDERFGARFEDLLGYLGGGLDPAHEHAGVRAEPGGPGGPEVWMLGSSSDGAALAARLGQRFSFAHFISPGHGPMVVTGYRRDFRPSPGVTVDAAADMAADLAVGAAVPTVNVAVSVLCAPSDREADRLATSADRWRLGAEGSGRGPLLSPEQVAAQPLNELGQALVAQRRAKTVVGGPATVRAELVDLATRFEVDELIVLTVCHDPEARLRSYELLAEAFDLPS